MKENRNTYKDQNNETVLDAARKAHRTLDGHQDRLEFLGDAALALSDISGWELSQGGLRGFSALIVDTQKEIVKAMEILEQAAFNKEVSA
jgi:hypothetical protein